RCAMEAMVSGAAVILCGAEGAGKLITSEQFDALRDYNFGRHVLREPLTVDYLLAQIQGYQAADAQRVGELARAKLGLSGMVRQWVELYGRLRPVARPQQEEEAVLRLL